MPFGKTFLLLASKLQTQSFGDLFGDLFLYRKDVGQLSVIVLAPEMLIVRDIDQFGSNHQLLTKLSNSPGKHRTDAQLLADFVRINFSALKAEDCAARYHSQLRQLRESVDNAFGNTIAEILHIGTGTGVFQGQDRQ